MATYRPQQILDFAKQNASNPQLAQMLAQSGVPWTEVMAALQPFIEQAATGSDWQGESDTGYSPAQNVVDSWRQAGVLTDPNDPQAIGQWINGLQVTDPQQALQLAQSIGAPVDNPQFVQATIQAFQGDQQRLSEHEGEGALSQFWGSARPVLSTAAKFAGASALGAGAAYGLGTLTGGLPGAESWMSEGFNSGLNIGQGGGLNLAEAGTMADAGSAAAGTLGDSSYSLINATLPDIASLTPASEIGGGTLSTIASGIRSLAPSKETIADLKTIGTAGGIIGAGATLLGAGQAIASGTGSTATQTQTTTAAPRTPEETRLIQLQIDALETQAAIQGQMTPIIQRQINAANAELTRAEAHDPATINRVIMDAWNDPGVSMEAKQQALSRAMRQYGITATEVSDAIGVPVETVSAWTGVPLSAAEQTALNNLTLSNLAVTKAQQGTAATPEQRELIQTKFFGERGTRDPMGLARDAVTQVYNDPNLSTAEKQQRIAGMMRSNNVTASEVATALGLTPDLVAAYTGVAVAPGESTARAATPGGAYGAGLAEIDRFRTETLRRINEEVASASGLSPTDSPIMALNLGVGEEVTRQQGILLNNMTSGAANAELNYPLAAAEVGNATLRTAGSLNLAASQFQNQLEQQAATNRFRLFSSPFQVPQAGTGAGQLALGLGNQRTQGGTITASGTRGLGLGDYGTLLSGIGGVMRGVSLGFN